MTNTLYIIARKLDEMPKIHAILWAAAVLCVAVLNIIDVLPDGATFAAVLTLPFMAALNAGACCRAKDV